MVEQTWEKPKDSDALPSSSKLERYKFLIGGVLILAAVVYLIYYSTAQGAQYFITLDQLVSSDEYLDQSARISGAVIGDVVECNNIPDDETVDCSVCDVQKNICYDTRNLVIQFTIAYIPQETDNLELTLHEAVLAAQQNPPAVTTLTVQYEGVKPDLLQNEAQAILTGELRADGVFYASELLLKCPSRYGDEVPQQTENEET